MRKLDCLDLGILRRSNELRQELAIVELEMIRSEQPKLCVWRSEWWELKWPPIFPVGGGNLDVDKLTWNWDTDTVIAFGNYLCFVDYCNGVLFCDAFDDNPKLLYLEFLCKIPGLDRFYHGRAWSDVYQNVGVTNNHEIFMHCS
ncbi:Os12g0527651 [Oryza sativa Japonica Group]|uniref:Os12g0527651 protein n=1 Tax=Oryza sativa subsp. japonica TaxID=39947 RepID=A0A0P0YAV8_ORYSJ|nr:Os12g0527651 [Oryza sativa Japonica Group]